MKNKLYKPISLILLAIFLLTLSQPLAGWAKEKTEKRAPVETTFSANRFLHSANPSDFIDVMFSDPTVITATKIDPNSHARNFRIEKLEDRVRVYATGSGVPETYTISTHDPVYHVPITYTIGAHGAHVVLSTQAIDSSTIIARAKVTVHPSNPQPVAGKSVKFVKFVPNPNAPMTMSFASFGEAVTGPDGVATITVKITKSQTGIRGNGVNVTNEEMQTSAMIAHLSSTKVWGMSYQRAAAGGSQWEGVGNMNQPVVKGAIGRTYIGAFSNDIPMNVVFANMEKTETRVAAVAQPQSTPEQPVQAVEQPEQPEKEPQLMGTIYGRVVQDGKPVAGATVSVGEKTVEADEKGMYRIENVELGKHIVKILSSTGEETHEIIVEVPGKLRQPGTQAEVALSAITPEKEVNFSITKAKVAQQEPTPAKTSSPEPIWQRYALPLGLGLLLLVLLPVLRRRRKKQKENEPNQE